MGRGALLVLLACRPQPVGEPPAASAPEGMVAVPAGSFTMGRDQGAKRDETPAHRVELSAFAIGETLVTVADFSRFVAATGHKTSAERYGFGMVSFEGMDDWAWKKVRRASWRAPFGPDRPDLAPRDDDPVVMVSWDDAVAYCGHHGQRLPTEAEWEYAMRAGSTLTRYPWGDSPRRKDGRLGLNFWQGKSHHGDTKEDGYLYVSPVRAFEPNAWGIYDPVGNTWQWVADWYGADTYARDSRGVHDPKGPSSGWARVGRGGSWWCSKHACSGYGLFARGKAKPAAAYANNSFRCARSLPASP